MRQLVRLRQHLVLYTLRVVLAEHEVLAKRAGFLAVFQYNGLADGATRINHTLVVELLHAFYLVAVVQIEHEFLALTVVGVL